MGIDKVHMLLIESRLMREEYKRDIVINYIAGNYSSNKHLCCSILNGKDDKVILEILADMIRATDVLDGMLSTGQCRDGKIMVDLCQAIASTLMQRLGNLRSTRRGARRGGL